MKRIIALIAAAALAGCGVETATTAATIAAAKQKELEQGRKTMEKMQQDIGKATEQTQQNTARGDAAEK